LLRREGRTTATRDDFVFLGIDQSTLEMPPFLPKELANNRALRLMKERPFPWSREVWALLLDKLFASGARLVMFEFVFSPPNDGDAAFHEALEKYGDRVVLGANIDVNIDLWNRNTIVAPNEQLISPRAMADDRVGYVNFWSDPIDGRVRAANFTTSDRQLIAGVGLALLRGEERSEYFSARALQKLNRGSDIPRDQRPTCFVSAQMILIKPDRFTKFSIRNCGMRIIPTAHFSKTRW
jgi:CHASE2 domain-containing sensor protein